MPGRCLAFLLSVVTAQVFASQSYIANDFDFGTWSPFVSSWQKTVNVCIWNEVDKPSPFRLVANGLNDDSSFRLQSDIQESIMYSLSWESSSPKQGEVLLPGQASRKTYKILDRVRCENGPSGSLTLSIDQQSLGQAPTGVYTDTILLTISPL